MGVKKNFTVYTYSDVADAIDREVSRMGEYGVMKTDICTAALMMYLSVPEGQRSHVIEAVRASSSRLMNMKATEAISQLMRESGVSVEVIRDAYNRMSGLPDELEQGPKGVVLHTKPESDPSVDASDPESNGSGRKPRGRRRRRPDDQA